MQAKFNDRVHEGYDLLGLPVHRKAGLGDYLFSTASTIAIVPALFMGVDFTSYAPSTSAYAATIAAGAVIGLSTAFNRMCQTIDAKPELGNLIVKGIGSTLTPKQKNDTEAELAKTMFSSLGQASLGIATGTGLALAFGTVVNFAPLPFPVRYAAHFMAIGSMTAGITFTARMALFGFGMGSLKATRLRNRIG